jgi:hypothetical protein
MSPGSRLVGCSSNWPELERQGANVRVARRPEIGAEDLSLDSTVNDRLRPVVLSRYSGCGALSAGPAEVPCLNKSFSKRSMRGSPALLFDRIPLVLPGLTEALQTAQLGTRG